jgi:hypothetical protein
MSGTSIHAHHRLTEGRVLIEKHVSATGSVTFAAVWHPHTDAVEGERGCATEYEAVSSLLGAVLARAQDMSRIANEVGAIGDALEPEASGG